MWWARAYVWGRVCVFLCVFVCVNERPREETLEWRRGSVSHRVYTEFKPKESNDSLSDSGVPIFYFLLLHVCVSVCACISIFVKTYLKSGDVLTGPMSFKGLRQDYGTPHLYTFVHLYSTIHTLTQKCSTYILTGIKNKIIWDKCTKFTKFRIYKVLHIK